MARTKLSGANWFWIVLIHSGLIQAGVYVVRPMASYQAINFGAEAALIGVVGSAFAIAPLIFAIPLARFVDRGFAGTALFLGPIVALVATIGFVFTQSVWGLLAWMPLLGIGHLLAMVGGQTLIAQKSPDPKYERNFGLLTFYASLGHAVGPFIGGLLADASGPEIEVVPALWFAIILFVLAALSAAVLAKPQTLPSRAIKQAGSFRRVIATQGYKPAIFVAGASTAVVDVMLIFLPVIGLALGFTPAEIGILLALRALASMGVRIFLGRLTQLIGMRRILLWGLNATLLGCVGLGLASNYLTIAILVFITGFAMGIAQPFTMAWVSRIAPKDAKGMAISVRLTSNRLGQVAIPALAGLIAAGTLSGVFYLMAVLVGLAAVTTNKALPKPSKS